MTRTRPFSAWVRIVHRWISMAFVIAAALVIVPVLPQGAVWDTVSFVAIALLVLLLVSGIWMAVHHYIARSRAASRRSARSAVAG